MKLTELIKMYQNELLIAETSIHDFMTIGALKKAQKNISELKIVLKHLKQKL